MTLSSYARRAALPPSQRQARTYSLDAELARIEKAMTPEQRERRERMHALAMAARKNTTNSR